MESIAASLQRVAALWQIRRRRAYRRRYIAERLRHIIPKLNELNYYKFPAALIEDLPLVSAVWRPHLTAAMSCYTKGPAGKETEAMQRARRV